MNATKPDNLGQYSGETDISTLERKAVDDARTLATLAGYTNGADAAPAEINAFYALMLRFLERST